MLWGGNSAVSGWLVSPSKCKSLVTKTKPDPEIFLTAAGKLGIRVIDLYAFTKDHPEWFVDGVHPNIRGNRAIAKYILNSSGLGP